MAFKKNVAEMIAYRAAYICSNPECNTLTIGAAICSSKLKNKKGEAAHIIEEKIGVARFTQNPIVDVESEENGLWLCANCLTLIDKNKGSDYPDSKLFGWKKEHEETISVLLRTHKNPMPLMYRQSKNRSAAQNIANYISDTGAYFQPHVMENKIMVLNSIARVRKEIKTEMKGIDADKRLSEIFK